MTPLERKYLPAGRWVAWTVFLLLLATYWLTVAPTVSYWDCPEYVAAAWGLEIGHPPGNPSWMLFERVVTMFVPPAHAALAVNLSSGLLTALAGALLALTIFRTALWVLLKLPRRRMPAPLGAAGAALCGALAFGWCDSVWYSAVEAEVYAMSIFMTSLCLWLMAKWAGTRSRAESWRLLILIAYLFGLSIGVHQLNLLCIPVLALIWAIRRNVRSPWRLVIIFFLSVLSVGCVLVGMMPSTIALAAVFELFCVNSLHLPQLSGVVLYVCLLGITLLGAIAVSRLTRRRLLIAAACLPALFLSGIFLFGGRWWLGLVLCVAALLLLVMRTNFEARRLTLAIWMLSFLLTGYASYALIPIRGDIPSPANAAMPGEPFAFASYLNRDQYGSKPLLRGATPYSRPLLVEELDSAGRPHYTRYKIERYAPQYAYRPGGGYILKGMKSRYVTTPELDMWFPRLTSSDPYDIECYGEWIGMDSASMVPVEISEAVDSAGRPVGRLGPDGVRLKTRSLRPTYLQQLQWLVSYQTGYMYWRYLLWNFGGRQNDRPSQGEVQHGNFITGFEPVDEAMLGAESKLPPVAGRDNPGRNRYWLLPLVLGIIGMAWLMKSRRRGMQANAVTAILFIMTGLAITVYLNQDPGEPRERDYSFLGSFLAYAVWIGFGSLAVARRCRSVWGFLIPLAVVGWMCAENWDDHDRSRRTAARNITLNILNSLEPDAIIFVNGDNGTFPLWYAQEVEGVRTDVRVVNLAYLKSPVYAANMMADWRGSVRVPSTLQREDILWDAFRQVKIGDSPDTLTAQEALKRLRVSEGASFPGRIVRLELSDGRDTLYDLSMLGGRGRSLDFARLMMFDIIATNEVSGKPRPVYWLNSLGLPHLIGLDAQVTEGLFARRLGKLPAATRDSAARAAAVGLLPPNPLGRHVYMDRTPASQVSAHRAALTAAAWRALRAGNVSAALTMAERADTHMGADPGSYTAVIVADTAFSTRRELAGLLAALADSLCKRDDSRFLRARVAELRARSGFHREEADSLSAQWQAYRRALPPRLRSKVAPVY